VFSTCASFILQPPFIGDFVPSSQFAGGGPVHITSGTAGLVWSFYLGRRRGYGTSKLAYRPHSVSHVVLGTCLIWFGWFGFNGGSEAAMNLRSVQGAIVTNIAASMGGLTWCGMDLCVFSCFSPHPPLSASLLSFVLQLTFPPFK
jgi:ammonia channel protein AmtB